MFDALFASQTNSVNSSFWMLLFVLKNPEIKKRIEKEIEEFYDPKDVSSMDKMETLNLAFNETARLAANHLSIREALKDYDVTVKGKKYIIPKGNHVLIFPTQLLDEKEFEKALEFNPDRHKNLSKEQKKTFMPFGGGKHMCPGRFFAMFEVKLFVVSMLRRFDIEFEKGSQFPETETNGAGFLFPNHDIVINLKKKK